MTAWPHADAEGRRLAVLRQYDISSAPDPAVDELTALASEMCQAPIALVSILGEDGEYVASRLSVGPAAAFPCDGSFAAHAMLERDLFIVPDAASDERFAHHPLVAGWPHLRFYAGAPLVSPEGTRLGVLSVVDVVPRELTARQQSALRLLGRQIMAHFELGRLRGQKLEAVGRLAGGVAHGFNNLLTAIMGHSELLLDGLRDDDPNHESASEILDAATTAAGLTRQLLAFSRRQIVEPTILDLNTVIRELGVALEQLIGEEVTVRLRLGDPLASIRADRAQIAQAIVNVAVNARDAMPDGGMLTIETANVVLDDAYARTHVAVDAGPYVVVRISDTGVGISPDARPHLFEPFFTTKETGRGAGLGLATVYGIVTQCGGAVDVRSEPGAGASFNLYLPAAVADPTDVAVDERDDVRTAAETILVVDDVAGLRELARRMLERLGYSVLLAANTSEAMQCLDRSPEIDIVLTDVVMPGGSGTQLARQLAVRRPEVKVIYMSGHTDESIARHGVLEPGIAFLHKPFTVEALGTKVREALGA